ncbi:hypothetical protein GCM10012320_27550 [Sinomonas cellulolyticus]|jgi:DNA-binding transcriptional MerR regulator|uniref:MerR family transcriptional regulator n=1 Tax=Sinomonas cellulolyticus TaxID=2801916 RepID=A0ABS1K3G0_9MICC|nr:MULTISPECIES: MerR family transcriptional regulator [Sinomonas]MBL0706215.1 MerR family transcriptional regulator [Sinomonas cellulolyticus]GHG55593.1 hypothetical protein GCM10012320_27550 [Sinomonas sp. KCTC 49339]
MRISDLAEITGTTPRTVRYYHQIGLLPVPPSPHGYREYGFDHVARMLRIRWVAEGGVPLDRLPDFIAGTGRGTPTSTAADLEAALDAVTARIAELTAQRERVERLLQIVRSGSALTPLPVPLVRLYEEIEKRTKDEAVRRGVRGERDLLEIAAYRGALPDAVTAFAMKLDDAAIDEAIALFAELQHLGERIADLSADDAAAATDDLAARTLGLVVRAGGLDLIEALSPFEGGLPPAIGELVGLVFPDPLYRHFIAAVAARLGLLGPSAARAGGPSRTASTPAEVAGP